MMTILTAYTTLKEQGKFLVAIDKDLTGVDPDDIWILSSYMKRYIQIFSLNVSLFPKLMEHLVQDTSRYIKIYPHRDGHTSGRQSFKKIILFNSC
jgi:hypothetical protein